MDFTAYTSQIQKAVLRYQKNAEDYGVSSEPWTITKLTPTEITINIKSINNEEPAIVITQTNNDNHPICIMCHDKDNGSFELTNTKCAGKNNYHDVIKALNDSADWLISNLL